MKRIITLIFLTLPLFGDLSTEEELLFVRRIEALSHDPLFLKPHIEEFCRRFPESTYLERFKALLGNVAFLEREFEKAISYFDEIRDIEIKKTVEGKKWHSLYILQRYQDLIDDISQKVLSQNLEARFYYAQALYREGIKGSKTYLEDVVEHFEILAEAESPYLIQAKLGLASVHRLLGNNETASKAYAELADQLDIKDAAQEEALFQAACALKSYDEEKAIKIASHLSRFGISMRAPAASLWLFLLIKGGQLEEIANHETILLSSLSEEKKSLCHAYLGKVYFEKKEWSRALENFQNSKETICDLMKAVCLGKVGHYEKALEILDKGEESLYLIEKAKIYQLQKRFHEAHLLLDKIPKSKEVLYLRAAISQDRYNSKKNEQTAKCLVEDLETAFEAGCYSGKELESQTLLFASCLISLKMNDRAILVLQPLCQDLSPLSANAHFLLSLAYFGHDDEKSVYHGEKGLTYECGAEKRKLHLYLFNAYLRLSVLHPDEEYTASAASHLYAVLGIESISEENLLWLGHHFAGRYATNFEASDGHKAILIFESLIKEESAFLKFERELVKMAMLYNRLGVFEKGEKLLEKLFAFQEKNPDRPWKLRAQAKMEEANLTAQKEKQKAICLYEALENSHDKTVAATSKLLKARLQLSLLPKTELKEGNPNVTTILQSFKELQIQKSAKSEPVHLEAAIEHAELASALIPEPLRDKSLLSNFLQVKEGFSADDDIVSKDYHMALELQPEKGRIYQAYMRYLDAKITELQAEIAEKEGNLMDAKTKAKASYALFSSLKSSKYTVTPYLREKACKQ